MPTDLTDDKPTLAQVMACCHQPTGHLPGHIDTFLLCSSLYKLMLSAMVYWFGTKQHENIKHAMVSTMGKLCTAALSRYRVTGTRFLPEPDLTILLLHIHITLNTASEARLFIVINSLSRVTCICLSSLRVICSDNGLSPGRLQTIIWTNAGILLIWTIGTHFGVPSNGQPGSRSTMQNIRFGHDQVSLRVSKSIMLY